ncbi:hypothetical protein MBLNU13_g03726t1 [Cladosporium sp. NU13]
MAIDEVINLSDIAGLITSAQCSYVYSNTLRNNPMQRLMRNFWIYEMGATAAAPLNDVPHELMEDIMVETLRVKGQYKDTMVGEAFKRDLRGDKKKDKYLYHQHNDKHPQCVHEGKLD